MKFTSPTRAHSEEMYSDNNWPDEFDSPFETDEFASGAEEVAKFVEGRTVATIADIVRAFPQHERVVMTMLNHLRDTGRVHWEEWRPLPTMIYSGDSRIKSAKYNWQTARERTWKHRVQDTEVTECV